MRMSAEEYSIRLKEYSPSTKELITFLMYQEEEIAHQMCEISADPNLTEEQVVEKLTKLKESIQK